MRKNIRSFEKKRRAFTLVELIIAMALFALVAGLVISFITYISRFSAKTEAQSDRISALAQLRSEIDYWFSAFDGAGYTIEAGDAEYLVKAVPTETGNAQAYGIRWESGEKDSAVVFTYPQEFGRGTVQGETAQVRVNAYSYTGIRFEERTDDYVYTAEGTEEVFRFTIYLRVTERTFACEITEGGAA